MFGQRIRSPKLREKRRKRLSRTFGLYVAMAVALFMLLSQLARIPEAQIKDIVIVGNRVLTDKELVAIVESELEGTYAWIAPRHNIFVYPRRAIARRISETFPRVALVVLDAEDPQKIVLTIQERQPFALYCEDFSENDVSQEESQKCYFLDESGFIFSHAPQFSGNVFFKYYGPIRGDSLIGSNFLPEVKFVALRTLTDAFAVRGLEPVMLTLQNEGYFELEFANGARIIFHDDETFDSVLSGIDTILSSNEFKTQVGERLLEIDYIDLRFGNKVFYKLN